MVCGREEEGLSTDRTIGTKSDEDEVQVCDNGKGSRSELRLL
jgi:hypothetical protein